MAQPPQPQPEAPQSGPPPPRRNEADDQRAELVFALSVLAAVVLLGVLYLAFSTILALLLLSGLIAYALVPLVDRVARKIPRLLAVLVVALGGVGLLVAALVPLAPLVAEELSKLPQTLSSTATAVRGFWERAPRLFPEPVARFLESVAESASTAVRRFSPSADAVSSWASSAAAGVTAVASGLLFVPLFVFVMLRRYHPFVERLAHLVPPRWRPRFFARAHEADEVLSGFVRGQLLVALLLAAIYGTAFTLVGIPLGLVIGILAGLGELVPFLGSIIALVFGSLMAIAGGQPTDALWVAGIYLVVQAVQGAILSPWIIGGRAHIRPVALVVALAIGGELFGFLGLLFAVPVAGLLKVAGQAASAAYRGSAFYRRRAEA